MDNLCIEICHIEKLNDISLGNFALLYKLLNDRNLLLMCNISYCLNSEDFYFKYEHLSCDVITSLITYLDIELDTLDRIRAQYEKLYSTNVQTLNENSEHIKLSLLTELVIAQKAEEEWENLETLIFSNS